MSLAALAFQYDGEDIACIIFIPPIVTIVLMVMLVMKSKTKMPKSDSQDYIKTIHVLDEKDTYVETYKEKDSKTRERKTSFVAADKQKNTVSFISKSVVNSFKKESTDNDQGGDDYL